MPEHEDAVVDPKFIGVVLAILVQAGGIIWWASSLSGKVAHNNYQIQMLRPDVNKAISFTELWPAGKWGSGELPSDTRQDLKIESLEKAVERLNDELFHIKIGNGD